MKLEVRQPEEYDSNTLVMWLDLAADEVYLRAKKKTSSAPAVTFMRITEQGIYRSSGAGGIGIATAECGKIKVIS